jgi:hypothetical protein
MPAVDPRLGRWPAGAQTLGSAPIRYPTSYAQQQWLTCTEGGPSTNSMVTAVRFEGPLDRDALDRALQQLVARHDALRTTLECTPAGDEQVVAPVRELEVAEHDYRDDPLSTLERVEPEIWAGESQPVNLSAGEHLSHVSLYAFHATDHLVTIAHHHGIGDAWSMAVLARDLRELYLANARGRPAELEPLGPQTGEFATWERSLRNPRSEAFWQERLAGRRTSEGLRVALPDDAPIIWGWDDLDPVEPDEVARLTELAGRYELSLPMALVASIAAALSPHAEESVNVAFVTANRTRRDLRQIVGCLADHVVLPIDVSGDPSFLELLERAGASTRAAVYRRLPFGRLHELFSPSPRWSESGITDVHVNVLQPEADQPAIGEDDPDTEVRISLHPLPWPRPMELVDRHLVIPNLADLTLWSTPEAGVAGFLGSTRGAAGLEPFQALVASLGRTVQRATREPERSIRSLAGA